jgi:hypothetical protein
MTEWLDRAFRREQRKRRSDLAASQAFRRANPLPPPDPRLIQGGGVASGDGAGYAGRYENAIGLSPREIKRRKK